MPKFMRFVFFSVVINTTKKTRVCFLPNENNKKGYFSPTVQWLPKGTSSAQFIKKMKH